MKAINLNKTAPQRKLHPDRYKVQRGDRRGVFELRDGVPVNLFEGTLEEYEKYLRKNELISSNALSTVNLPNVSTFAKPTSPTENQNARGITMRPTDQLSLFGGLQTPRAPDLSDGGLNYGIELRHRISECLKKSPKSRYQIAAEMSRLLGIEVSKSQLDAWTAESRSEWRFPVEYLVAFEAACETFSISEFIASKRGCRIVKGDEVRQAEIGRLEAIRADLSKKLRSLKRAGGEFTEI